MVVALFGFAGMAHLLVGLLETFVGVLLIVTDGRLETHRVLFQIMSKYGVPITAEQLGGIMTAYGGALLIMAALLLLACSFMLKRKHHFYVSAVAALLSIHLPIGTMFGVWSLVNLNKKPVKALFIS